ncbi:MAG: M23 family metallopeptidase [Patescibacteria group bacterium]
MSKNRKIIAVLLPIVIASVVVYQNLNESYSLPVPSVTNTTDTSIFSSSRVTKKLFGIYVTPKNSPVQPEKFTGYHTGIDFETTSGEANVDVHVPVLFDGKLVVKKSATGYGGVVVIESAIEGQLVTTVYGHLKLSSVITPVGQFVKKGDTLGILGKAYSNETGGERKHLHLAIHKGGSINIFGYVQTKSALNDWLDPKDFIR